MTNRRTFIKTSSLAVAGVALASTMPMAACKGANEKLVCGAIGVNGMGWADLAAFLKLPNTECAAICDVDESVLNKRIADTEKIQGKKPVGFKDYRKLLEMPGIDVVIIGTPDHWHCLPMVDACQAGKDVYCEKPLGNSIEEINVMEAAANKYNTVVQVGMWQRSDPHWREAVDFVKSGQLGKIRTVRTWAYQGWMEPVPVQPDGVAPAGVDYDFWLGPAPYKPYNVERVHANFRGYWDYDGGGLGDMGQHYLDPVQYMLGKDETSPVKIEVDAPQQHYDAVGSWRRVTYTYADGCQIILDGENRDKDAAYIEGPNGKIYQGFRSDIPNLKSFIETLPEPEPQITIFSDSVKSRKKFALNEMNGFRSATLVNLGIVAVRLGRTLHFDLDKLEFIDDEGANRLINQPMRAPWVI